MINDLFSFKPVDTLFFKGSEPMVMGENHSSNFNFPPPAHTIEGAIRTKLYFKDKEKYKDLINIGKRKGGFSIIGPMFLVGEEIYVPAPYSWYKEVNKKEEDKDINEIKRFTNFTDVSECIKKTKIIKSKIVDNDMIKNIIKTKAEKIYWAKSDNSELESTGGSWIKLNDIHGSSDEIKLFNKFHFFKTEPHVGIALKEDRTVRKSHIYAFTHARLMEDVEIAFGINKIVPLDDGEVLQLGAEQRFGSLKRIKNLEVLEEKNKRENNHHSAYMSLSILEGNQETNEHIIATGKIQYLGGWDIHKGFHKDMVGYFPPGTVLEKEICSGLISI